MRNLLLFVFAMLVVYWVRRGTRKPVSGEGAQSRGRAGRKAAEGSERMLACALCGVHVPESEGVRAGERFYCCEAHRRQAEGR